MHPIFRIGLACLLSSACLPAANRALIIGIGDYKSPINALPGIDKDVALAQQFAALIGYKPQDIKVLFNKDATLNNIKEQFNTWLREAGPEDRIFIYFSGHGSYVPDTNNDEKDDGRDELLVTYDTTVSNGLLQNYLLDDDIDELVSGLASRHVLIVLDSCHSGSGAKTAAYSEKKTPFPGAPRKSASSRRISQPRWMLVSACRDNETAGASSEGSFLTTTLSTLVQQRKTAGKPLVFEELKADLEKGVTRNKVDQHPGLDGSEPLRRENWFAANPAPSTPPPPPPPPPSGAWTDAADQIEKFYEQRLKDIPCKLAGGSEVKVGSTVDITCDLPHEGFFYVINIGASDPQATVLFPNKWAPSAQVTQGEIVLPSEQRKFRVRASLPANQVDQSVRLYMLLTYNEVKSVPDGFAGGFGPVTGTSSRSLASEGPEGFEAAKIEFRIVK